MRILLVNHPDCLRYKGGDTVVLRKTGELLRERGFDVSESFDPVPDATGYDCAHLFNSNTSDLLRQCEALKQQNVPVVSTPIYHQLGFLIWANECLNAIFSHPRDTDEVNRLLDLLRSRHLQIATPQGETLVCTQDTLDRETTYRSKTLLQTVDYLLPASYMEMAQIQKTLLVTDKPFQIVRYGTNLDYLDPDPSIFVAKYGLSDFVLMVGRFDGSKNQIMLLHAMKDIDIPLVLVGNMLTPEYVELCKRIAGPQAVFIPYLEMNELRSAYAAARVHVLPSFMETCGMVTVEAVLANCNVVVSSTGYELEYFRELAYYCDPLDGDSIRNAVLKAYENYSHDDERRKKLKKIIMEEYSWQESIDRTIRVYEKVCSERAR